MDTSPVIAYSTYCISAFLVIVRDVHTRWITVERYVRLPLFPRSPRSHMSAWTDDGGFPDCRA